MSLVHKQPRLYNICQTCKVTSKFQIAIRQTCGRTCKFQNSKLTLASPQLVKQICQILFELSMLTSKHLRVTKNLLMSFEMHLLNT